jgi:chemotaxis receptor (MCP) glutamine deamidase CheD
LKAFLIGGSNVLRRLNDTIGRSNIDSVEQVLFEKGIRIIGKEVGGYERRTAIFNIGDGVISFTEGDSKQKNIWITGLK